MPSFYIKVVWFVKMLVKAKDWRCRRLEQDKQDGSVNEVLDKDNRW